LFQFIFFKDITDMQTDILPGRIKQFSHLTLRQPNRFFLNPDLKPEGTVSGRRSAVSDQRSAGIGTLEPGTLEPGTLEPGTLEL